MKNNQKDMELDKLGIKYGTDKSSLLHGYLDHYQKHFKSPKKVSKVVELGLQRGREWRQEVNLLPSLRMWQDYFPAAHVYGFDIKPYQALNDKMTICQGDQGKLSDLLSFAAVVGDQIEILIEDGSHKPTHQLATFLVFFPLMKKGGVYILEDCKAIVQDTYPTDCQILNLIAPILLHEEHYFIPSLSAGEKSAIAIIKK